ncbi:MAG: virulence RhuM family protein [Nitrosomonadales bacterium]|nr:virulence RhuM family protein [Nitrosomonadales bacterium]
MRSLRRFLPRCRNMHYAIHGQTAAGLIVTRADSSQPNMGLTTWEGAHS